MPHLIRTLTGPDARFAATDTPPMGPGLSELAAQQVDKLEVWGSSFADEGEDWCEFKVFSGDHLVGKWRVDGY